MTEDPPNFPPVENSGELIPLDESGLFDAVCATVKELFSERRQPSAGEILIELTNRFGWRVRTVVIPAIQLLREDRDLTSHFRNYLFDTLSDEALSDALRGEEAPAQDYHSTLDDLLKKTKRFRNSAAFRDAIQFVARFRDYAPYNNMLVKLQNPGCSFYASERDWWRRFERSITEDARPMLILAPMHPVMLVYDLDSTVGRPLPEKFEKFAKAEGKFDPVVLDRTIENAERISINIQRKKLSSTYGGFAQWQFPYYMRVVVHDELDAPSAYSVLCHELAHILLGHVGPPFKGFGLSRGNLSHATVEIEAEAVSYIVCQRYGLISSSAEYLSSFMTGDEIPKTVSLELITKVAGKIEQWGQRLFPMKNPKAPEKKPAIPLEAPVEPKDTPKSEFEAALDEFAALF